MKYVDYLIVGQGIAGSLLAYELIQAGKKIAIVNPTSIQSASSVAEAVINPYNIRKQQLDTEKAEMIAVSTAYYDALAEDLQSEFTSQMPLHVFEDKLSNDSKIKESKLTINSTYEGVTWVNARKVIATLRQYFIDQEVYIPGRLLYDELVINSDKVSWKKIVADKVIFCEGAQGKRNPLLAGLPFTHNRGDVLIVKIPDLPQDAMYEFETRLVPIGNEQFWMGSNHVWEYDNLKPNEGWMMLQFNKLKDWLNVPFTLQQQWVAERPTTEGQFPLIGFHPIFQAVGVFNGLGSKGFMLAAYYATRFKDFLIGNTNAIADYDMERMRGLW